MSLIPGWGQVRLGDVVVAKYGKGLPQLTRRPGDVPVYGSNGVVGTHDEVLSAGPTIVIGRKGSLGEVNLSTVACWPIDTTYFIDEPGPFSLEFLFYLLRSLGLTELDQSTAIPGLSRDQLYSIEVPLPPLLEQRRIVAHLRLFEKHSSGATMHVIATRRAVERFRQAVLAAACSGRLTEDWRKEAQSASAEVMLDRRKDSERARLGRKFKEPYLPEPEQLPEIPGTWIWGTLPELGELGRGKSKHRPRNDPKLYGGAYPFIQTGDVARSRGLITSHTQTYNDAGLAQSRLWPARTVCITIAANIADSGLLTYPACFPDSVVGLIADDDAALPEYVELFIRTARRDLAAFAPATAQANINLAILAELAVPVPPLEEQYEIINRASRLLTRADSLEARIEGALGRLDRSSQAVLAKAFRGELVGLNGAGT